ncbi:MAG: exodeoxyribonuclease III [Bacilli bacterium]|nr:exodeoxyribonuclease III [Bacilli bacterium]
MKLVSWNVNGLRAVIKKGFFDFFDSVDADIFAIQETKMQEEQKDFDFPGYHQFWSSAIKKGYSGTLILTKKAPLNVYYGLENNLYTDEGRVITLEFENFYFVCVYSPNSQRELTRLEYRMVFENNFNLYLNKLKTKKGVIVCGDLNVAHEEIDLANPKANTRNAGFTIEERTKFSHLLKTGFIDSFRYLYPDTIKYTWWSYMQMARLKNIGWRIDYFLTSENLKTLIKDSLIYDKIEGSDHCPVSLIIDF